MDNRINGVKIISANENISEGSKGIILEYVLEGMAEYYSADLRLIRESYSWINIKCKFNGDPITFGFNFEPAAITSEHSCSEAFLCPNTAFYGGIRAKCLRSLQNFFYIFQGVLGRNSYADVIRSD